MTATRAVIVVPCYNEAERLDLDAFLAAWRADASIRYLFVDDGSTDDTRAMLDKFCGANPAMAELLALGDNQGKAEAVRRGVLHAATKAPEFVGYWDADLAAPLDQVPRLLAVMDERPAIEIVLGSRVNLLGHEVRRKLPRHYIGRVFATAVATGLSLPVYDTQCGAKLIRCKPHTLALFDEPFFSRWIFDAELLARAVDWQPHADGLAHVKATTYELPLDSWQDVDGSRLQFRHLWGAARDLARIFGKHTVASRLRRGRGGLTYRVSDSVRRLLRSLSIRGEQVSVLARAWRIAVTVPIFGVFVLWTRLREWLSGPVAYEVTALDGNRFVCRVPDLVQSYLFMFGVWEPDYTAFVRRRMALGGHFIDVGANVGYHSLVASGAAIGDGRVIAIEASPVIAQDLRMHVELNERTNITVINQAASDHHGELSIFAGPLHNTGLTTTLESRGLDEVATVTCAPLGAMVGDDVAGAARLVKIDVEGAEGAVLRGMTDFLERCPSDVEVMIELSPRWWTDDAMTPADVLQPLFDLGFNAYEIDNNLWPWRYLWPDKVRAPRRSKRRFSRRPRRIDLVLSRTDNKVL